MDKPTKTLVLCVDEKDEHILDSILVKCDYCDCFVWVSLHNVDKSPVCIVCLERLVKEAEAAGETIEPVLSPQDVIEAMKYLRDKKRKGNNDKS